MNTQSIVFENHLKIDSKPYKFKEKIPNVEEFIVIKQGCLAVLMIQNGSYFVYYPSSTPTRNVKIKEDEAKEFLEENKHIKQEIPPLSSSIGTIILSDVDCKGDLWLLNNKKELFYFINSGEYKKSKNKTITFENENDEELNWTNLYLNCDIPEDTKITLKVSCNGKSDEFINKTNIFLYEYRGKKLDIDISLTTNDKNKTPIVYSIEVVKNRKSYIEFLPSYYKSVNDFDFETLSRFLAIFQEVMISFENDIVKTQDLLNPMTCDNEYLEWLSNFLAFSRDYRWEEKVWRNLLDELPALYKRLGTKSALKRAIEIYCKEVPSINNIDGKPFEFCVKLSPKHTEDKNKREVLEAIIWAFKPAHTVGHLFTDYNLNKDKEFVVGSSELPFRIQTK